MNTGTIVQHRTVKKGNARSSLARTTPKRRFVLICAMPIIYKARRRSANKSSGKLAASKNQKYANSNSITIHVLRNVVPLLNFFSTRKRMRYKNFMQ